MNIFRLWPFYSDRINIKCLYFAFDFAGIRSRKTVSIKREWVYGVQRATTYKTWSQTGVWNKPSKNGEGESNLGWDQMSSFSWEVMRSSTSGPVKFVWRSSPRQTSIFTCDIHKLSQWIKNLHDNVYLAKLGRKFTKLLLVWLSWMLRCVVNSTSDPTLDDLNTVTGNSILVNLHPRRPRGS